MKSCLFILIAVFVLAGLAISLGTLFFTSYDTKPVEDEPKTEEVSQ